jgi:hypothetical protein
MLTPPLLVLRVREQRSSSAVATASPASKSEAAHDEPHPKDPMPAAQVWAARPYYETSGTAGALTRTLRSAVLLWLSPLPHPAPRGFERTHCRLGQGAHPDEVAAEPPLRLTELYWQRRWPSGPGMGYRAAWDTAPRGIPRPSIRAGFASLLVCPQPAPSCGGRASGRAGARGWAGPNHGNAYYGQDPVVKKVSRKLLGRRPPLPYTARWRCFPG